jgi:CDP-6-deoxy-D-xylo-4-hexulose-3-dehydrase
LRVPASGASIGESEKAAMHRAVDRGWLTASGMNTRFEQLLQDFTGIKHARTCNSGSSANLLAVAAMVESGRWKAGDEIVTVAAGFPTTINPLLVHGLKPVFVDISLPTYQVNAEQLHRAISHRTRGVMLAHTLGIPFDVDAVLEAIGHRKDIWLIEDFCDALGSTYKGRHVGNFGALATCSFFPAHHITTGEGGAVFSNDDDLIRVVESVRDWGRDCWCEPGANNSCGKRFEQQHGDLPRGYDHKYTFTRLGYNLKLTEISAACGVVQIEQAESFVDARKRNAGRYGALLRPLADRLILPEGTVGSDPSWFGYPITLREEGVRPQLQRYLSQNGVDSRLVFGGNLTRQPYMSGREFLVASELRVTDQVMNDSFWVGLHPSITDTDVDYVAEMIGNFCGEFA